MNRHDRAIRLLSPQQLTRLQNAANQANRVESYWKAKIGKAIEGFEEVLYQAIINGMSLEFIEMDFFDLIARHAASSMKYGILVSQSDKEIEGKPGKDVRLALGDRGVPTRLPDLRAWYDRVRRRERVPKRIQRNANAIKNLYLRKCQDIWLRHSKDFRSGEVWNQKEVRRAIKNAAKVTKSRANTIVTTETTRYYNTVREAYYEKTGVVSHYLFLAIRDSRTTEWCRDRSGLVYKSGSEYLRRERCPCHPNCRSEIVPLSPFNPKHKALIANESLWRENNNPKPLPENWNK